MATIIHSLPHDMLSLLPHDIESFAFEPRSFMASPNPEKFSGYTARAKWLILQNGQDEIHQSLSEHDIMNYAESLQPNEIVIPDEPDFELHASIAMRFQNKFPNAKIVMNIQGKNAKELTDSFFRINNSPSTNKIGLPQRLPINRTAFLNNLNTEIYFIKQNNPYFNVLPILLQEIEDYQELSQFVFTWLNEATVITTKAIRLAYDGILLSQRLQQEPKKRDIHKFKLKKLEFLIAYHWNKIKLDMMARGEKLEFKEWINTIYTGFDCPF